MWIPCWISSHVKSQINVEACVCDGRVTDPGNMEDMSAT